MQTSKKAQVTAAGPSALHMDAKTAWPRAAWYIRGLGRCDPASWLHLGFGKENGLCRLCRYEQVGSKRDRCLLVCDGASTAGSISVTLSAAGCSSKIMIMVEGSSTHVSCLCADLLSEALAQRNEDVCTNLHMGSINLCLYAINMLDLCLHHHALGIISAYVLDFILIFTAATCNVGMLERHCLTDTTVCHRLLGSGAGLPPRASARHPS